MRIQDQFTVSIPLDDAWKVLLDLERVAPCMPGAQLQEIDGEEYRGIVKVKLGAITAQFKGVARFVEVDEAARRVVLRAEGREVRGQGNAAATVTASLEETGDGGTRVMIDTDLSITGRVAQFGRGVMADVSARLLGDFAKRLEEDLLGTGASTSTGPGNAPTGPGAGSQAQAPAGSEQQQAAATPAADGGNGQRRTIDGPDVEPLDLMAVAGSSVAQRVMPAALVLVLVLLAVVRGRGARWLLSLAGGALVVAHEVTRRRS